MIKGAEPCRLRDPLTPGAYATWLYICRICTDPFAVAVPLGYEPPTAPQTCSDCIPVEIA